MADGLAPELVACLREIAEDAGDCDDLRLHEVARKRRQVLESSSPVWQGLDALMFALRARHLLLCEGDEGGPFDYASRKPRERPRDDVVHLVGMADCFRESGHHWLAAKCFDIAWHRSGGIPEMRSERGRWMLDAIETYGAAFARLRCRPDREHALKEPLLACLERPAMLAILREDVSTARIVYEAALDLTQEWLDADATVFASFSAALAMHIWRRSRQMRSGATEFPKEDLGDFLGRLNSWEDAWRFAWDTRGMLQDFRRDAMEWLGSPMSAKDIARHEAQILIDEADGIRPAAAQIPIYQKAEKRYRDAGLSEEAERMAGRTRDMVAEGEASGYGLDYIGFEFDVPDQLLDLWSDNVSAALSDGVHAALFLMCRCFWESCDAWWSTDESLPRSWFDELRRIAPDAVVSGTFRDGRYLPDPARSGGEVMFGHHIGFRLACCAAVGLAEVLKRADRGIADLLVATVPTREGLHLSVANALDLHSAGNYEAAMHVAIPMIEKSLRLLLRRAGASVAKLGKEGAAKNKPLEDLLRSSATWGVLPESVRDVMSSVLSQEGVGWNLRNDVCHGIGERDERCNEPMSALVILLLLFCWYYPRLVWLATRRGASHRVLRRMWRVRVRRDLGTYARLRRSVRRRK